jgi:hypothetical protein
LIEPLITCPTPVHSTTDIRFEADVSYFPDVVCRAKSLHEFGLSSRFVPIQDMNLEALLYPQKSGKQPNRSRPRDEDGPRLPICPPTNRKNLLPRLCDDRCRFE